MPRAQTLSTARPVRLYDNPLKRMFPLYHCAHTMVDKQVLSFCQAIKQECIKFALVNINSHKNKGKYSSRFKFYDYFGHRNNFRPTLIKCLLHTIPTFNHPEKKYCRKTF